MPNRLNNRPSNRPPLAAWPTGADHIVLKGLGFQPVRPPKLSRIVVIMANGRQLKSRLPGAETVGLHASDIVDIGTPGDDSGADSTAGPGLQHAMTGFVSVREMAKCLGVSMERLWVLMKKHKLLKPIPMFSSKRRFWYVKHAHTIFQFLNGRQ
jgi:hypothetical protein